MNKRKVLIGVGAGLVGVILLFSIYKWATSHRESDEIILYGNVDIREVDLGFRVSGRVKSLYIDEGDPVRKGDLIAELDATPYEEEVWQAKANVQALEISLSNAEKQFLRRKKAIKTSAVSEEDFENALSNQKVLSANLEQARATLARAFTNCNDTKLYAPSDGTVLTRIREPGSVLSVGEPVFTVSLDKPVWIRAYVSEPDLGKIYPDMAAEVTTDTDTNPIYQGRIGFISPVAEFTPKNVETTDLRTDLVYRVRVVVENPDRGLRQGMPVTVKLKKRSAKQG
jgi:HlyD family secretion protein